MKLKQSILDEKEDYINKRKQVNNTKEMREK